MFAFQSRHVFSNEDESIFGYVLTSDEDMEDVPSNTTIYYKFEVKYLLFILVLVSPPI